MTTREIDGHAFIDYMRTMFFLEADELKNWKVFPTGNAQRIQNFMLDPFREAMRLDDDAAQKLWALILWKRER